VILGIAETRAGRPLNQEQLNRAREMFYGTNQTGWGVFDPRADGLNPSRYVLADVINIGLELLGINERALFIDRFEFSPGNNIPAGTQATLLRVPGIDPYHHFLEGDAMGNMIYDPLHDLESYINRTINRFDAFSFYTPL
jgi:hypothetical protein